MANLTPAPSWLIERPIAHRAYHDLSKGLAENSYGAFAAAIDAGFAIECDLQISATGEPVVFHDPVLGRMTGVEGNVRDKTPKELERLKLFNTDDGIYTLEKHLGQVAGKVPLILELKGVKGKDSGFVEGVVEALSGYSGAVCVMSFDHWICAQFAKLLPDVPRGLTAEGGEKTYDVHLAAMHDYDLQFVSYDVKDCNVKFVHDMREQDLPVITWTVRDDAARNKTFQYADQMTFEGFDPREMA